MRVTAFTKYGNLAASTRQRLCLYLPRLAAAGISVQHYPLLDNSYVRGLETGDRYSWLLATRSYLQRFEQVLNPSECDLIWVYAELFPYLPAGFERLVFRRAKPVVYDFDDAFFHQYDDSPRAWVRALLGSKLEPLLGGAAACFCGNRYLQQYALKFCDNSIILPTVVDSDLYVPAEPRSEERPPVIGWIGSPSTWAYVRPVLPLLQELCRGEKAQFHVVGAGAAAYADKFAGMTLIGWSEEREIADIQAMDIGIMPVPDEPWARGKSGYKLIQYMACGLPVVASPVGVNCEIVEHGRSGFLASRDEEWLAALGELVGDADRRRKMGAEGRRRAVRNYSLAAHAPRLVDVMRSVVEERALEA